MDPEVLPNRMRPKEQVDNSFNYPTSERQCGAACASTDHSACQLSLKQAPCACTTQTSGETCHNQS